MTAQTRVLQQTMMRFQLVFLLVAIATPALAELRFAVPSYSSGPVHFPRTLVVPPPIPAVRAVPLPSPVLPVPLYRNLAIDPRLEYAPPPPPVPEYGPPVVNYQVPAPVPLPVPEYGPPVVNYPVPAPAPLPVYGPPAPPPPPPLPVVPYVPSAEYGPPVDAYPAPVPVPFPEYAPPPPPIPALPVPVDPVVAYGPPGDEFGVVPVSIPFKR